MSMLKEVKGDLYANKGIVIVDIQVASHIPDRDGYWSETVNIIVAPKKGIYEVDKLQLLMEQLVPSVGYTCKDSFRGGGGNISFGKLYFDENIGLEKKYVCREIMLDDEGLLAKNLHGFIEGKCLIETRENIVLRRRTWVCLYPNVQIALQVVNDGKDKYSINRDKLLRYQGRFARLLTRLGFKP